MSRALAVATAFTAITAAGISSSRPALADSGWQGGLRIGGAASTGGGRTTALHFRIGASLDWLFTSGLSWSLRVDTTHDVDATAALLGGYAFEGMRATGGLPLALLVGPLYALDKAGDRRAGVRLCVSWGLWTSLATVDLEVDARRRTASTGFSKDDGIETIVGLSLRVVPWAW